MVAMTPPAPAWGSQVPPGLPKPLLLLAPTAPRALPGSIRERTPPGKPQPHLPKPHTNPRPHPTGHGDAPRAPPGTETPNPASHHVPSAASPRCARGQAAATLLFCPEPPEQPADCGRRKQKAPAGSRQRVPVRPPAPGLCHHRPQTFLPAAAPCWARHHAGQGAGLAPPAQLCPRTACPWGGT